MKNYNDTNFITGLRTIAVVMVFIIHTGLASGFSKASYCHDLVSSGKYGVQIFFVISGFTIFYQFFHSKYSLKNFIIVRFIRIGVAYYPILLISFILSIFNVLPINYWANQLNFNPISLTNYLMHITYLGFWNKFYLNSLIGVEWTLYVEFFYYLLLASIIQCFLKNKSHINFIFILFIFSFIFIISIFLLKKSYLGILIYSWSPLRYGLFFMLGGVAYIIRYRLLSYKSSLLPCLSNIFTSLFFIGIFIIPIIQSSTIKEILYGILTVLIISCGYNSAIITRILNTCFFQLLGHMSFSIYLIHLMIIDLFRHVYFNQYLKTLLLFLIIMILSKIYSSLFEERFYFILKNHYIKKYSTKYLNLKN